MKTIGGVTTFFQRLPNLCYYEVDEMNVNKIAKYIVHGITHLVVKCIFYFIYEYISVITVKFLECNRF